MSENYQEYLTQAQLEELIREVEETQMLEAPEYLKAEILEAVREKDRKSVNIALLETKKKEMAEKEFKPPQAKLPKKSRRRFLLYSLKVSCTAAAAIVLLFLLPAVNTRVVSEQSTSQVNVAGKLNEKSAKVSNHLLEFSNQLISFGNWQGSATQDQ